MPAVPSDRLAAVHDALISWYRRVGRDLPWRRTRDPYKILVSEIMLQQTQVDRVIPKYHQFLQAFPTLEALGESPVAEVIRVWAGLGYNRRAVRLHAIARQAAEQFDGVLPASADALRELDGLGAYTSNAVACFSGEAQVGVVDTNVRRVLGRVFADEIGLEPTAGPALQAFAESVLPAGRAYEWNQALMDLGASVCTARAPDHNACPLALHCAGRSLVSTATPARRAAESVAEYTLALPEMPAAPSRPAPSRPAKAKAVQPFEQTTRYFRGRIVDACRTLEAGASLGLDELGTRLRADYDADRHRDWVAGLVEGLRRDGLVAVDAASGEARVTLP